MIRRTGLFRVTAVMGRVTVFRPIAGQPFMAEQDRERSHSLQREPGSKAQEKGPEPLYFLQRHTASDENLSPGCTF